MKKEEFKISNIEEFKKELEPYMSRLIIDKIIEKFKPKRNKITERNNRKIIESMIRPKK